MNSKHMMGVALVAMLLLTACGKKAPAYTKYIPKESNYVMAIDVQAVMGKLQKDSLSVDNMMDAFKDSSSDYAKAASTWKDFKDAGVDFSNKVFVAVTVGNMMGAGSTGFEMVGGVKDVSKLEAFIKKQPHFNEIKKGDGFSYAGEDNMIVGWNDDAVIIVSDHENNHNNYGIGDSSSASAPRSESNNGTTVEKLKKYFKLEKDQSIASVDAFKDLMGKTADVSIFSTTSTSALPPMVNVFVPKLKDLTEGIYSATLINFEDGKVDVKTTGFVGEKLAAIIKKYPSADIDMGMVENYPSNKVDGLISFNFNTQLIPALIREAGADAAANAALGGQMGMNIDDLAKIFKGDFAFVISDFGMLKKDYGSGTGKNINVSTPTVKMLFAAKIGDKAAFDKLISIGEKQGFLLRQGNSLVVANNGVPMQGFPYAISLANDMLTITSDSALMTSYMSKTQKIGISSDVKSELKSTSAAFYIDIEAILSGFGNDILDSTNAEGKNILDKARTTFKNAWFTAGNFDGKKTESKGELILADTKTNSLSQLVRFSIYASQQHMAGEAKREKMDKQQDVMMNDTSAMVAPITK